MTPQQRADFCEKATRVFLVTDELIQNLPKGSQPQKGGPEVSLFSSICSFVYPDLEHIDLLPETYKNITEDGDEQCSDLLSENQRNRLAVAPFRCLAAMSFKGSTTAGILPGCPSLDRGSREAEVGFEPRTFYLAQAAETPSYVIILASLPSHLGSSTKRTTNPFAFLIASHGLFLKPNEAYGHLANWIIKCSSLWQSNHLEWVVPP
ncbi:hypothetical protein CSKR_107455 [Clonorchis sinensis]|uniref:Uncharacterized protein n=1 Tax=Clonorchis sinensis TaxID=79923 RepID=A0A419PYS7_CLOSI|nr:hypothetical protein CSKR_107455 [Clonorchis sinensis]